MIISGRQQGSALKCAKRRPPSENPRLEDVASRLEGLKAGMKGASPFPQREAEPRHPTRLETAG
ncbi:hypothetical protein ASAP_0472 [Asaia bogorensis]|uniref:Uncharacterized protein n=1 Tax=Asaia bogorensis TaxID=91915 RepID=A0A060QIB5_9PROT|nr:hypothetical protein ASAP_0472 [Asaia bogorensis]